KRLNSGSGQISAIPQTSLSQVSNVNTPDNQTELSSEKEKQDEIKTNVVIIEKEEYKKMIAELQNKKERLKKEIAEKEKIIHQKVLKHIFNNYQEISQELGG